jgi:hypothetical protein
MKKKSKIKKVVRKKRPTKLQKLTTELHDERMRTTYLKQGIVEMENRIIDRDKRISELLEKTEKPFIWIMRDGQPIRPSAMEEGHLRNTICFIDVRDVEGGSPPRDRSLTTIETPAG